MTTLPGPGWVSYASEEKVRGAVPPTPRTLLLTPVRLAVCTPWKLGRQRAPEEGVRLASERRTGEELEFIRRRLGLDVGVLYLTYVSLGGTAMLTAMQRYLRGVPVLDADQHDVLAQAIDGHAIERGMEQPARYRRR